MLHTSILTVCTRSSEKFKFGKILFEISKRTLKKLESYRIYLQDRLFDYLDTAGFHQVPHHNGLLQHESRSIIFSLVDDFGIKYVNHDDVNYLAEKLRKIYEITMDWTSSKYLLTDSYKRISYYRKQSCIHQNNCRIYPLLFSSHRSYNVL